jgi:hypothetical protein
MPETFKFVNATLTTEAITSQNLYTSPANTTSIIFMGQLANIDPTNPAAVSVTAFDVSANNRDYLAANIPVPVSSATTFLTGKLVLEAGDVLSANANGNNRIDVTLSILQLT